MLTSNNAAGPVVLSRGIVSARLFDVISHIQWVKKVSYAMFFVYSFLLHRKNYINDAFLKTFIGEE
jgi:hypothetical protein